MQQQQTIKIRNLITVHTYVSVSVHLRHQFLLTTLVIFVTVAGARERGSHAFIVSSSKSMFVACFAFASFYLFLICPRCAEGVFPVWNRRLSFLPVIGRIPSSIFPYDVSLSQRKNPENATYKAKQP